MGVHQSSRKFSCIYHDADIQKERRLIGAVPGDTVKVEVLGKVEPKETS